MSNYTISCKACGTANRIPADKEGKAGRCGRCHAALAPLYYRPQSLTQGTFDLFLQGYPGPILAEFWAPW
jgi:thioredoxin 2